MHTVQIFGGAPSNNPVPPQDDAERWGLNNLACDKRIAARFRGATRWFDLHSSEHIQARRLNAYPWLCRQTIPVYRWAIDAQMPMSTVYPLGAVALMFPGCRIFTSTLDWMLAAAIVLEPKRIELFGWRMHHPQYRHQVTSGQWWVNQALSRGIEVVNYSRSALVMTYNPTLPTPLVLPTHLMYGLETTDRSKLYHAVSR